MNDGVTFTIESGAVASFAGRLCMIVNTSTNISQSSGSMHLAANSALVALSGGVNISGGDLSIKTALASEIPTTNIYIILTITGGNVTFENMGGDARQFGEFRILGDVTWTGGTYQPFVDANNQDNADHWHASGTITLGGTFTVSPTAVDGENNPVTPNANMEWHLFDSDETTTAANNTPSLDTGWQFVKDPNNPQKWWHLKSV